MTKETEYDVGYRKPPENRRFKPGSSGNPKGRPKRQPPSAEDLYAILDEEISVRQGNRVRRMQIYEVSVRALAREAIREKNLKSALNFLKLCEKHKVVTALATQRTSGVAVIPKNWDRDDWMSMFGILGAPPWPGPYSGLVGGKSPSDEGD